MASAQAGPSAQGISYSVLTLLTTLLSLPPFFWHIKHRNLAASSLVFWIILTNFLYFVNSLIWPSDNLQAWWRGYGLCDIEVKLQVAAAVGIPAALVCVLRNLARVLDTDRTVLQPTPAQRRRLLAIDLLLCFGAPIYVIIVHYVVQSLRYYIFAISGCVAAFDNSWASIVLIQMWSPVFSVVAVYYSIIVLYRIRKYRREFAVILSASSSGLTKSRFLRLFLMSLTLIILGLPVQGYVLYKNSTYPMAPYSWARVHGPAWGNIILIPTNGTVLFDHWIQLAVCTTIFAFFGLGHDAMKMYRRCLLKLGFGTLFPRLHPASDTSHQEQQQQQQQRPTSETGSYSSRAQMFFKEKFSRRSSSSSARISPPLSSPTSPDKLAPVSEQEGQEAANPTPTPRLARFLTITGPYSNVRALSLFSRAHTR